MSTTCVSYNFRINDHCHMVFSFRSSIDVPAHHHHHEELLTHSYSQGDSKRTVIGETIGQRLDKVTEKFPDREAVVFTKDGRRATFADFREEV